MAIKKEKNIIIRVPEEVLYKYKTLCEENGFTMSKKIRNYIINDIKTMVDFSINNKH